MKKIFAFALILSFYTSFSKANILDVSRISEDGEFSASFGAAFKTGKNKFADANDDFRSGTIEDLGVELDYTFLEDWTISFSTSNNYADSQVGLSYKILTDKGLKLDFSTNYGIAWTKDAVTKERIGANNIETAFRVHGIMGDIFQWAVKVSSQFVFDDPDNFLDLGLTIEGMYYYSENMAVKTELHASFDKIDSGLIWYDRSIKLGAVYNMTEAASVHPFVKYHFKTKNSHHSDILPDDYWELGTEFSVAF